MGQKSVPEKLVAHQKLKPGYNPKSFKQHNDQDGSLQLHITTTLLTARRRFAGEFQNIISILTLIFTTIP
jgi:hypothetical protein